MGEGGGSWLAERKEESEKKKTGGDRGRLY